LNEAYGNFTLYSEIQPRKEKEKSESRDAISRLGKEKPSALGLSEFILPFVGSGC
jgi:hypothetical protein